MHIYFINIIIVTVLGVPFFINRDRYGKNKKYFLIFSFVLNFVLIGLRHKSVGADTAVYMDGFIEISELPFAQIFQIEYNFEPGYIVYNKIISLFATNSYSIIIFSTFISLVSIYYFIYKYSKNVWLSVFIFSTIGGIFQITTFLRQYLALSILLFCIPFIMKRKFIPFLILLLIAVTFHKTSVLFLLVYIMSNVNIGGLFIVLYTVVLGISYISIDYILPIILNRFYPGYLVMEQWLQETGGYKFLLFHGVLLILLLFMRDYGRTDELCRIAFEERASERDMLYSVYIVSEMILFAVFFVSLKLGLISRLMITLEPFVMLVVPEVIDRVKKRQLRVGVVMVIYFVFMIFWYILLKNTYIHNIDYRFLWQG